MSYNTIVNIASSLRPMSLDEFVGQEHLVGKDKIIRRMVESNTLSSIILWGPPGVGKTTLAHIIAKEAKADFHHISGVTAGKSDLLKIIEKAQENAKKKIKTILFIDEIHRWNKAQQDALLPYVENGLIILIGATTENPSFEVISALLSRTRVFVLKNLSVEDLKLLIKRALSDTIKGLGKYAKSLQEDAEDSLIRMSGGDARILLNALELAVVSYKEKYISLKTIENVFQTKSAGIYDKKAEEHYNVISAFIKSMRGSSVDGTLYYLMKMLESGEDPKFIARRMIIFAAEDIGLADRGALVQANAGFESVQKIGMPESQLVLAYVAVYLARAPKSRAVTNAMNKAKEAVYDFPNESVPLHLRNAPTKLMKNLGYGKEYIWSDAYVGPVTEKSFLPEKLKNKKFFES